MSEGTRPGGLTALAVLNFVSGGYRLIDTVGLLALEVFRERIKDEEARQIADALAAAGPVKMGTMVVTLSISSVLMIVAGIGYLQQRRTLGRRIGNVAALTTVAAVVLKSSVLSGTDGGFGFGTIPAVLYPVLSLVLLNTTFKEDFIR